jgi:hypothetical protein
MQIKKKLKTPFIKNPLPQPRALFRDRYPAMGLHATILKMVLFLCFIKHKAMKAYGGWRYISAILDLGTRWR